MSATESAAHDSNGTDTSVGDVYDRSSPLDESTDLPPFTHSASGARRRGSEKRLVAYRADWSTLKEGEVMVLPAGARRSESKAVREARERFIAKHAIRGTPSEEREAL